MQPISTPLFLSPAGEAALREQLALSFLAAPPIEEQSAAQRTAYRRSLRQLQALETGCVLQAATLPRPLARGDAGRLLHHLLAALAEMAKPSGLPLTVDLPASLPRRRGGMEARLLSMAAVGLVRAACAAAPGSPVTARLLDGPDSLRLLIQGTRPPTEPGALAVAQQTARLHQGCLAVCGGSIGLSVSTHLPSEYGEYICPTVTELLLDSLSSIYVGFYAFLDER